MCTDEGSEERSALSLSIYWILYSGALMEGHIERATEFYSIARYLAKTKQVPSSWPHTALSETTWVLCSTKPTLQYRWSYFPWLTMPAFGRQLKKMYGFTLSMVLFLWNWSVCGGLRVWPSAPITWLSPWKSVSVLVVWEAAYTYHAYKCMPGSAWPTILACHLRYAYNTTLHVLLSQFHGGVFICPHVPILISATTRYFFSTSSSFAQSIPIEFVRTWKTTIITFTHTRMRECSHQRQLTPNATI